MFRTRKDSILHRIELTVIDDTKPGMKELRKAQKLIRRLHRRDLYKCYDNLLLSPDDLAMFNPINDEIVNTPKAMIKRRSVSQLSEEEEKESDDVKIKIDYQAIERKWENEMNKMFEEYIGNEDIIIKRDGLECTDIVVKIMSLSFGIETQHPMEKVLLYNSEKPQVCYQVHCDQIITMTGGKFKEVVVRVFVKKSEWKQECQHSF
eukprot:81233_1